MNRPSAIADLIGGVDRYNPSNAHLLEEYLLEQLAHDTYDLLANLALLKLYQFNPSLCSPHATLSILFLSLAHAPFAPDFALAWSLLSDSFVCGAALPPPAPTSDDEDEAEQSQRPAAEPQGERETAERLKEMSGLLLARKFKAFWRVLADGGEGKHEQLVRGKVAELLKSSAGFESLLRENIAVEVEATFKGLARATLESFLGLEG
jgi:translation initiation factor 3 subunit K